ncbi:hypothetical protein KCP73_00980 [Salmonella enterica subsp. enterica]|nr:hypothetical protein KCP73_00980 [Salmonella enterica subsp. enterica]
MSCLATVRRQAYGAGACAANYQITHDGPPVKPTSLPRGCCFHWWRNTWGANAAGVTLRGYKRWRRWNVK